MTTSENTNKALPLLAVATAVLALIFSAIGLCGLFCCLNVEYGFVPVHARGPEGGLIEAALSLILGGVALLIAFMAALISFLLARRSKFSRAVLIWCALV